MDTRSDLVTTTIFVVLVSSRRASCAAVAWRLRRDRRAFVAIRFDNTKADIEAASALSLVGIRHSKDVSGYAAEPSFSHHRRFHPTEPLVPV